MCILFTYVSPDPGREGVKLILASNRDEMFNRPARPAHQWSGQPATAAAVYGGTDMQPGKEGGTWLAMNERGRIGALLNIGQKKELNSIDSNTARGAYVVEWVTNPGSMSEIFDDVKLKHGKSRQPFKLVAFDVKGPQPNNAIMTHDVTDDETFLIENLQAGFNSFGNNTTSCSWKKVLEGEKMFTGIVKQFIDSKSGREHLLEQLLELLSCKTKFWPDASIAEQFEGKPMSMIECLSAIYVDIPGTYGTRTQTVIVIDSADKVFFYERTMASPPAPSWTENRFDFTIKCDG